MDIENTVVNTTEQTMQDDAAMQSENEMLNDAAGMVEDASADGSEQTVGNAKDFSRALNKRVAAERAKIEKTMAEKYAADLDLASRVRAIYAGKTDEAIMDDMLSAIAKDFASQNNVPEALAKRLLAVEAKTESRAHKAAASAPAENDKRLEMLQSQIDDILNEDGVDMFSVLKEDEEIREKVASGKWDINRAYAHYVSSGVKQMPRVNRSASAAKAKIDFANMSDEEFDKYDKALKAGRTIKL